MLCCLVSTSTVLAKLTTRCVTQQHNMFHRFLSVGNDANYPADANYPVVYLYTSTLFFIFSLRLPLYDEVF